MAILKHWGLIAIIFENSRTKKVAFPRNKIDTKFNMIKYLLTVQHIFNIYHISGHINSC